MKDFPPGLYFTKVQQFGSIQPNKYEEPMILYDLSSAFCNTTSFSSAKKYWLVLCDHPPPHFLWLPKSKYPINYLYTNERINSVWTSFCLLLVNHKRINLSILKIWYKLQALLADLKKDKWFKIEIWSWCMIFSGRNPLT